MAEEARRQLYQAVDAILAAPEGRPVTDEASRELFKAFQAPLLRVARVNSAALEELHEKPKLLRFVAETGAKVKIYKRLAGSVLERLLQLPTWHAEAAAGGPELLQLIRQIDTELARLLGDDGEHDESAQPANDSSQIKDDGPCPEEGYAAAAVASPEDLPGPCSHNSISVPEEPSSSVPEEPLPIDTSEPLLTTYDLADLEDRAARQTQSLFRAAVKAMSEVDFRVDERSMDACKSIFADLEKAVNRAHWATKRRQDPSEDFAVRALEGMVWQPKQLLMFLFDLQEKKRMYRRRALCAAQMITQISAFVRDTALSDAFLSTWLGAGPRSGPQEVSTIVSYGLADSLKWAAWNAGWHWVNVHRKCKDSERDMEAWSRHRDEVRSSVELPKEALELLIQAVWAAAQHAAGTRAEGLVSTVSKFFSGKGDEDAFKDEFFRCREELIKHDSLSEDLASDLMWMIWNICWFTADEGRGRTSASLEALARAERHFHRVFRGEVQWRGVNLGGWFLMEPGPCDFFYHGLPEEAQSKPCEWSCCESLGPELAEKLLTEHRKTYFTKEDFMEIRSAGLSHVRLPFGFWCVAPREGEPYVGPCLEALDRALDMIEDAGLMVLLDLHGTVGGETHEAPCGHSDKNWTRRRWNPKASLEVLRIVAERYAGRRCICGLGVANEPSESIPARDLARYYEAAVSTIRQAGMRAGQVAVFLPIFTERRINEFLQLWKAGYPKYEDVVFDVHFYQCFGLIWNNLPQESHLSQARKRKEALQSLPTCCVSEWSLGLPGWISNTLRRQSEEQLKAFERQFAEAQLEAYESATHGWFFWTWRDSAGRSWNMKRCIDEGVLRVPTGRRDSSIVTP
eukprot:TRINITY_DN24253_c0_g2_i1.p1 TRINITY_DN24253_c0_g2~~TRINITY_DN24253_c0_g2_i1.p1  ORF type:complete len:862 (-),score=170.96 TRINITY_DN24253_c0_g2_i1:171-2735(-)